MATVSDYISLYHPVMERSKYFEQCILLCNSLKIPKILHYKNQNGKTLMMTSQNNNCEDNLIKAAQYFEEEQFQRSLKHLNIACEISSDEKESGNREIALYNRCTVLLRLSCEIRYRPAKMSDATPLYGNDPQVLTTLSLKDAKSLLRLIDGDADLYVKISFAQYLLEDYNKALEVCYRAWSLDVNFPLITECLNLINQKLKKLDDKIVPLLKTNDAESVNYNKRNLITPEDFECILCMKLLYEPVTTPCGHSFCSNCLRRALDHTPSCPCCRIVLHITPELPISITLKNIINNLYPEEYEKRELEINAEVNGTNYKTHLPLFVLCTLYPGERICLNIFEPRYRLMIRRVMQGSRKFGMIAHLQQNQNEFFGTECEILEFEPLLDGRYYIKVIGKDRIRAFDIKEQDGYRIAEIEKLLDDPDDSLYDLSNEVLSKANSLLARLPREKKRCLIDTFGDTPLRNDPFDISFWAFSFFPDSPLKFDILKTRSTKKRLEMASSMLSAYII